MVGWLVGCFAGCFAGCICLSIYSPALGEVEGAWFCRARILNEKILQHALVFLSRKNKKKNNSEKVCAFVSLLCTLHPFIYTLFFVSLFFIQRIQKKKSKKEVQTKKKNVVINFLVCM